MNVGDDLEDGEKPFCRNCHETDPVSDLISPCDCNGSLKFVHRQCLDTWRSVSPNPLSFYQCENCTYQYQLIQKNEFDQCAKTKFYALVARDFLIVFVLVNLVVLFLGWIGDLIFLKLDDDILDLFPQSSILANSKVARLYCFGGLELLFVLGIVGIVYGCNQFCCKKMMKNL